ncbi:MAG: hypothetical protein NC903_03640, partial [Candidatus Omnitrophica bacterium]|nr:hypothetical protein [Candidatus Omnitrophota bacterium]
IALEFISWIFGENPLSHPDFTLIEPISSQIQIDQIRELNWRISLKPIKAKLKAAIIDCAHSMTKEAQNCFLKTLEEPPPFVKFIFATTQPHKVLPTILSRCHHFNFKRIPLVKIMEQLKKIISEEKIKLEENILFSIARASQGSLRDAESILDQLLSFKYKDNLSTDDLVSILGIMDMDILISLTEKIIQKDPRGAIAFLNKIVEEGKDLSVLLSNLIEHFRNLLIAKISSLDFKLLDLPSEFYQKLIQQSQFFTIDELMHFFNILVNIHEMTKKIDSLNIPLELGLIKLCQEKKIQPKKETSIEKEIKTSSLKIEESHDAFSKESKLTSKEAVNLAISFDELKNRWQDIIESLKKVKMSVASYLSEGTVKEIRDDTVIVAFAKNNSFHKEILEKQDNLALIQKVLEDIFKIKIKLRFILADENTPPKEDNPFLKSILETFNAKPLTDD